MTDSEQSELPFESITLVESSGDISEAPQSGTRNAFVSPAITARLALEFASSWSRGGGAVEAARLLRD